MFLVGQTASAAWLAANTPTAATVAKLFASVNEQIHAHPDVLMDVHAAFGVPDTETAAIKLLPSRLRDIYATNWDAAVFAGLDKQIDVAVKLGILARKPAQRVYTAIT